MNRDLDDSNRNKSSLMQRTSKYPYGNCLLFSWMFTFLEQNQDANEKVLKVYY